MKNHFQVKYDPKPDNHKHHSGMFMKQRIESTNPCEMCKENCTLGKECKAYKHYVSYGQFEIDLIGVFK
jgi:hypothetical protein